MSEEPAAGQNIVPFGKHKGKDVLELTEADPNYIQWLVSQEWFRDKYVTLHQTIINRGPESEETPEHNALQVLFLDDEFCLSFCRELNGAFEQETRNELEKHRQEDEKDAVRNFETAIHKLEYTRQRLAHSPDTGWLQEDQTRITAELDLAPASATCWPHPSRKSNSNSGVILKPTVSMSS
jgi:hypothetical protein